MKVSAEVAAECGSKRCLGAETGHRQQFAFTRLKFIDGFSSGLIDPVSHLLKTATTEKTCNTHLFLSWFSFTPLHRVSMETGQRSGARREWTTWSFYLQMKAGALADDPMIPVRVSLTAVPGRS